MSVMETFDIGQFHRGRPRTPLTTDEKAAFLRAAAAADRASVTRADKNLIFGRPPPDEEDRLCLEKIGMTMEELRRKAMSDSETLIELECDILRFDATYDWYTPYVRRPLVWKYFLPDEEYRLVSQVFALLANDYDDEISRRANVRAEAFRSVRNERYLKSIEKEEAELEAKCQKGFNELMTRQRLSKSPIRLSPEERALYLRIIADPASVTRADKNQVFEKPPPDEEDRLCKEKVGITMEELRHKVLSNPNTLTEDECNIITRGAARRNKSIHKSIFWWHDLVEDDKKLYDQVIEILGPGEDKEIMRRAYDRHHDFDEVIAERNKKRKQQQIAEREAKWFASMARWAKHLFDAKLSRWGFVIFRTVYGEGSDHKLASFQWVYRQHTSRQLSFCWDKAVHLTSSHNPLLVSDPLLEGADMDALRQRFKAMREQGEIPAGIATDCFLVADQAALDDPYLTSEKTYYEPKAPGEPDPWQSTITVRVINPDYEASVPIPSEGDLAGYQGEITIPLPKVSDWLYYSFFAKSEDWETRYKLVKGGPAELMHRSSPYPAYRPGTEPDNLPEIPPPETAS